MGRAVAPPQEAPSNAPTCRRGAPAERPRRRHPLSRVVEGVAAVREPARAAVLEHALLRRRGRPRCNLVAPQRQLGHQRRHRLQRRRRRRRRRRAAGGASAASAARCAGARLLGVGMRSLGGARRLGCAACGRRGRCAGTLARRVSALVPVERGGGDAHMQPEGHAPRRRRQRWRRGQSEDLARPRRLRCRLRRNLARQVGRLLQRGGARAGTGPQVPLLPERQCAGGPWGRAEPSPKKGRVVLSKELTSSGAASAAAAVRSRAAERCGVFGSQHMPRDQSAAQRGAMPSCDAPASEATASASRASWRSAHAASASAELRGQISASRFRALTVPDASGASGSSASPSSAVFAC